jgi:alpha-mannosidase
VCSIQATGDALEQSIKIQLVLPVPARLEEDRRSRCAETVPLRITTQLSLYPGSRRLEIRTEVENPADDHRLRVHFPAPFSLQAAGEQIATGGHFEVRLRPAQVGGWDETWVEQPRPEMPMRDLAALSDGANGLAILSRGLREVQALEDGGNAEIALTLLRCVGWLSRDDLATRRWNAGPSIATPQAQQHGQSIFEYAIMPFAGNLHSNELVQVCRKAGEYQAPMLAVPSRLAGASEDEALLPASGSFLLIEPAELVLSAIKEAENGSGWIVRAYNLSDRVLQARLRPWRRFHTAERVNIAEQPVETLLSEADGSLHLPVGAYEIVTIKFSIA